MPLTKHGDGGYPFPRPRPSDWGIGVTVCIAAACEDGRGIVAVCDRLVSVGSLSAESILKAHRVHGTRWIALVAGDDVGYAPGVLRGVRERLAEAQGTPKEIRQTFEDVCADEIARKVRPILSKWNLTIEQIHAGPSASLHLSLYDKIVADIDREKGLECAFLVCGFGPNASDEATILEILPNGKIRQFQDVVNFWAIGSGKKHAIQSLVRRQYGPRTKFSTCVYCVCEAKFSAEKDRGVGKKTWLFLIDQDGVHVQLGEAALMKEMRSTWVASRKSSNYRIPATVIQRIAQIIPRRFNDYE